MSEDPVPLRLLDDPGAAPLLRRALARAAASPPVNYDADAGHDRLQRALDASAAAGGTNAAVGGASPRGVAWSALAVGTALVLVAAALGGAWAVRRARTAHTEPVGAVSTAGGARVGAAGDTPGALAAAAREVADAGINGGATEAVASTRRHPERGEHAGVARSAASTAVAPVPAGPALRGLVLERERRQLDWALAELDHDPSEALRVANQGHREFPDGELYEEREATAIRALAQLHRTGEARDRARRFLARYPRGTQSGYVRQLVGAGALDAGP